MFHYVYSRPTPFNPIDNKNDWVWSVTLVCAYCVIFSMLCIWKAQKSNFLLVLILSYMYVLEMINWYILTYILFMQAIS